MDERTVCVHVKDDGAGAIIWSDPSEDPDLDELIEYLIDEEEIGSPGTYILLGLTAEHGGDPNIDIKDFAVYSLIEGNDGRLEATYGMPSNRVIKLTTWPPKQ